MAGRITITPEELTTLGGDFMNSAAEIGEIMTKLESGMSSLESSWEGAVKLSFFEEYQQRKPSIQEFQNMVNVFGEQLKPIAQELQNTDETLANSIKG